MHKQVVLVCNVHVIAVAAASSALNRCVFHSYKFPCVCLCAPCITRATYDAEAPKYREYLCGVIEKERKTKERKTLRV